MAKKKRSSSLRFVCAIAMSMFSLIALFVGTLAWFQSYRFRQAQSDDFGVESLHGKFKKLTLHQLLNEGDNTDTFMTDGSSIRFDKTPFASATYNWETKEMNKVGMSNAMLMGEYSPNYQSAPVLMLVELMQSYLISNDNSYEVKASITRPDQESGTYESDMVAFRRRYGLSSTETEPNYIGREPGYDFEKDASNKENPTPKDFDNPLSSVIRFYSTSYANDDALSAITTQTAYQITKASLDKNNDDVPDEGHFFSMTIGNDGSTTYNGDFNESTVFFSADVGATVKYIAVIFDYYKEALEHIYNINLGNEVLDSDTPILFACDWNMVM